MTARTAIRHPDIGVTNESCSSIDPGDIRRTIDAGDGSPTIDDLRYED